ncbi:hypothetical protein D3C85_322520 [compost metagenome]
MNKIFDIINKALGGAVGDVLDKFFPDKAEKMKFELELKEQLFKEIELTYKDVDSAREMQKEALRQDDRFAKRFVYILSGLVMLNTVIAGVMSFFVSYPLDNKEMVLQYYNFSFIVGGAQMMQFFYGRFNTNKN